MKCKHPLVWPWYVIVGRVKAKTWKKHWVATAQQMSLIRSGAPVSLGVQ